MLGAFDDQDGRRRLFEERSKPAPLVEGSGHGRLLASRYLGSFLSFPVELRVVERDRELGRYDLEQRQSFARKGADDQAIFQIEHSEEARPDENGEAQYGARPGLRHVRIAAERRIGERVRQDQGQRGSLDVANDRLRHRARRVPVDRSRTRRPELAVVHQRHDRAPRARVLEDDPKECLRDPLDRGLS